MKRRPSRHAGQKEKAGNKSIHAGHRVLNDEERLLWREIGRSLDHRNLPMPILAPDARPDPKIVSGEVLPHEKAASETPPKRRVPEVPAYYPPVSKPGSTKTTPPGLDTKTERKLQKGRLQIEARLDLHGMVQNRAHDALQAFLAECYARDRRMVLVITGKGRASGGILRNLVPRWLAEPALRLYVSGYGEAHQIHGGSGALYVRLRKRSK